MNRYPLWKNLLIVGIVLVATIYALPNLFGEEPAIQVSPARGAVDQGTVSRIEFVLKQAQVPYEGVILDATGVKVRFTDTETQIRARDVVQKGMGEGYTVALNMLPTTPAILRALGAKPMTLGLDLRGGVHFLLQIDARAVIRKAEDAAAEDMRRLLREKKIRYTGAIARREGGTIEVRFKDADQRDQAITAIRNDIPDLDYTQAEGGGEFVLRWKFTPAALTERNRLALEQNITTLHNRVNELGVAEPVVAQQGADRIVVQLPGVQDTARAKEILGRTATLEVRLADEDAARTGSRVGVDVFPERGADGSVTEVVVKRQVILTGDRFVNAQATFDDRGRPAVAVQLDSRGGRVMAQVTRENLKRPMAIILFEKGKGEAISVATIQGEFSNRFQITGTFTSADTNNLALLIRAGSLAAPVDIIEERTVGPSLGKENIERGFHSTWIGFAAIAVFMLFYYHVFGVTSVLALGINVLLLIGALSLLPTTLTLPGMAGIALTIGMAIDANVLINERIREELRNGNSPHASIAAGYGRAFGTIIDSNITTLIAGLALFGFGSGPVRGFAVVLCLGILTSMFSGVMVSRALVNLIYGSKPRLQGLSIGKTDWDRPSAPTSNA